MGFRDFFDLAYLIPLLTPPLQINLMAFCVRGQIKISLRHFRKKCTLQTAYYSPNADLFMAVSPIIQTVSEFSVFLLTVMFL
jgi:hypothetical protein